MGAAIASSIFQRKKWVGSRKTDRMVTHLIEGRLLGKKFPLIIDNSDDLIFLPSSSFSPKEGSNGDI
jgi:hypothetical protein